MASVAASWCQRRNWRMGSGSRSSSRRTVMHDCVLVSDADVNHKRYSVFAGQRAVAIQPGGSAMPPLVVGGRYQLVQRLGWGGMATVWRAEDLILGRPVAVKVLHEGLAQDVGFRERFEREAHHAALLSHTNIV